MKKLCFVAAFLLAVCVCAQAQDFSKWTVTPRVGFNVYHPKSLVITIGYHFHMK